MADHRSLLLLFRSRTGHTIHTPKQTRENNPYGYQESKVKEYKFKE